MFSKTKSEVLLNNQNVQNDRTFLNILISVLLMSDTTMGVI